MIYCQREEIYNVKAMGGSRKSEMCKVSSVVWSKHFKPTRLHHSTPGFQGWKFELNWDEFGISALTLIIKQPLLCLIWETAAVSQHSWQYLHLSKTTSILTFSYRGLQSGAEICCVFHHYLAFTTCFISSARLLLHTTSTILIGEWMCAKYTF